MQESQESKPRVKKTTKNHEVKFYSARTHRTATRAGQLCDHLGEVCW